MRNFLKKGKRNQSIAISSYQQKHRKIENQGKCTTTTTKNNKRNQTEQIQHKRLAAKSNNTKIKPPHVHHMVDNSNDFIGKKNVTIFWPFSI